MAAGSVVDRVAGRSHALFPVAIGGEEGSALGHWVRREGAVATLEIGLGYGIATLFICEALLQNGAGGRHVAIDPHQVAAGPEHRTRFAGTGLDVLEEAELAPVGIRLLQPGGAARPHRAHRLPRRRHRAGRALGLMPPPRTAALCDPSRGGAAEERASPQPADPSVDGRGTLYRMRKAATGRARADAVQKRLAT